MSMLKLYIILVCEVGFILFSEAAYIYQRFNYHEPNHESFDYFTFAQLWPETTCWNLNSKWQSVNSSCNPCTQPKSENWTLHGLWPGRRSNNGENPFNCAGQQYSPSLLDGKLRARMKIKYPTLKLNSTDDAFWSHEWTKHGTCASEVKDTNSLKKYFSKSLELLDNYNIQNILKKANILPGRKYEYNDIIDAIYNALGVNGNIACALNPDSGEQYLDEAHICLDKSFEPIDCERINKYITVCNPKRKISYPKNLQPC